MNKVLVTGATGFIGQHAIPLLRDAGFEIHVLQRGESIEPQVVSHRVDLLHPGNEIELVMSHIDPAYLLHLAWCTKPGEYWTSVGNIEWVEASLRLVRAFIACGGKKVVCAGTCAEYDWAHRYCSEFDTPIRPTSLYGVSKNALRAMLEAMADQSGVDCAWARIFFPYGPGEDPARLISSVTYSLLRRRSAICRNSSVVRDYIYVQDVARALVAILQSEVNGPINIGSGVSTSIGEIARQIESLTNTKNLLECQDVAEERFPFVVADIRRLHREVGFTPAVDLTEGIAKTVQWLKSKNAVTR